MASEPAARQPAPAVDNAAQGPAPVEGSVAVVSVQMVKWIRTTTLPNMV